MIQKDSENPLRSIEEFAAYLKEHGIPTDAYGKDKAKTIGHLYNEVVNGSCVLVEKSGSLLREVQTSNILVFYKDGTRTLYLKEDKQVFKDNRERKRDFRWSVSEKMEPREDPFRAAVRGMEEELGIVNATNLQQLQIEEEERESPSYPGLVSTYNRNFFQTFLSAEQFNPDGYVEVQEDKSTFWVWEEV